MKKIIVILTASSLLFACSKVGKNEFLISGTAKGIANGKTIVLEKQDEVAMKLVPIDTVKIQNGKFEIKGKYTETGIYTLQLEKANGKIPVIIENAEIKVDIDKDSVQKSKISGTYSNDEFYKFNNDLKIAQKAVQKEMMEFQNKNMQAMTDAQKNKDSVTVSRLMKEYGKIQEKISNKYISYAESHPKSFISVLILDGMFKQPNFDFAKAKKIYESLDASLKSTKSGKSVKLAIDNYKGNSLMPSPHGTPAAAPAAK